MEKNKTSKSAARIPSSGNAQPAAATLPTHPTKIPKTTPTTMPNGISGLQQPDESLISVTDWRPWGMEAAQADPDDSLEWIPSAMGL